MFENCVYDASGGIYCTYGGFPFHCTQSDTPDQWAQLQQLLEAGELTVAPYVAPQAPSGAELAASRADDARAQRDLLVSQCDWVVNRHRDQIDAGVTTSLTSTQYQAWLTYRQSLRDIPKQSGWPSNITWPPVPPAASDAQT
ncbi:MAG TPA: phage tail assembly chaperone [Paraburkholderia sp.]